MSNCARLSAVISSEPLSSESLLLLSEKRIPSFSPTQADASANPSFSWSKYIPFLILVVSKNPSLFKSNIIGSLGGLQPDPSALWKNPGTVTPAIEALKSICVLFLFLFSSFIISSICFCIFLFVHWYFSIFFLILSFLEILFLILIKFVPKVLHLKKDYYLIY